MKIKYIMYKVQDYSLLFNNATRPVKCEGLQRKPKLQSSMDNPETLAALGTQDTG
jgi:hypothetical protein